MTQSSASSDKQHVSEQTVEECVFFLFHWEGKQEKMTYHLQKIVMVCQSYLAFCFLYQKVVLLTTYVLFINQLTVHIKNERRETKPHTFLGVPWSFLLSSSNVAVNYFLFNYFKEVFSRKLNIMYYKLCDKFKHQKIISDILRIIKLFCIKIVVSKSSKPHEQ